MEFLRHHFPLENLRDKLGELKNNIADGHIASALQAHLKDNVEPWASSSSSHWQQLSTFWPPRYVRALRQRNAMVFFGAGVSLPAGLPTWSQLITESFKLDPDLVNDDDLKSDPLTLAELAGQYLGSEKLQEQLRKAMQQKTSNTCCGHLLLAALRCPYYVTTNYDTLFETAWAHLHGTNSLAIVTNDGDLLGQEYDEALRSHRAVLFKIHGCASSKRSNELLILTRRDYRYHYRVNDKLFGLIRQYLRKYHTLFVGFSHKDPEVSRLVEDAIHGFEIAPETEQEKERPQFYSLQFNMLSHTPEVFAARGIVALQPPAVLASPDQARTQALAVALCDLLGAKTRDLHESVNVDNDLISARRQIAAPLKDGIDQLARYEKEACAALEGKGTLDFLSELLVGLGTLGSQGVFLINQDGTAVGFALPDTLNMAGRQESIRAVNFKQRPYFQEARSFRRAFVSDATNSVFNENATFFLCQPVLMDKQFQGLLFSACQIGQWKTPIDIAKRLWSEEKAFLLIDTNGVALVPPLDEFPAVEGIYYRQLEGGRKERVDETQGSNLGYPYRKLLGLSRRDAVIRHISHSVVPVRQDDDVLILGSDWSQFTVVSDLPRSRWKVGVSMSLRVG
jgi:hypothetical protein